VTERDDVVGYKSPPRSMRYPAGVSGNPKGRPKGKRGLPYAKILDRMVTIKDGVGARQVTAEEAFLLYLRKKALDGSEAAQERLEEIQVFRREHDPALGPEGITTIVRGDRFARQSQLCAPAIKNGGETLSLPTSRPNQARAMACPARARSAWRPASKYNAAGDRRRRDADAWEGPMAGLVGDIALEKQAPTAARLRY
jgi:hypothetical protein